MTSAPQMSQNKPPVAVLKAFGMSFHTTGCITIITLWHIVYDMKTTESIK